MSVAADGGARVEPAPEPGSELAQRLTVVRVLPDVSGIDRSFDYLVPPALATRVDVGAIVRARLQHRRVRGFVLEVGASPPDGIELVEIEDVVSMGPGPEVVALAKLAAWRYAGRLRPLLVSASPPRIVKSLPAKGRGAGAAPARGSAGSAGWKGLARALREAIAGGTALVRLPPAAPRLEVVEQVLESRPQGSVLVLVPERDEAARAARHLERAGHEVALLPEAWAAAAAGGRVVVGNRQAVLGPAPDLAAVVVLDAHAESYQEQRSPTWRATVLATERARSAGVPCVLVSPCPTLELMDGARLVEIDSAAERGGWPLVEVVDRREEDPRTGLFSPRLAPAVRAALEADRSRPVVCVLNRTGRARLLACVSCGDLARCEACGAALRQDATRAPARDSPARDSPARDSPAVLRCPRCDTKRPVLCASCGAGRLRVVRAGVTRAGEELAALVGVEVVEMSRATDPRGALGRLLIGTEAVLHRVRSASLVAFLDLDQELLAPRFEASEQALALLALGGRMLGGRSAPVPRRPEGTGRLLLQTRLVDHEVVRAVVSGNPTFVSDAERPRRIGLRLPPVSALARLSGESSPALAERLRNLPTSVADGAGSSDGRIEVVQLAEGRFLVRARGARELADALRQAGAPAPGVRIEVSPSGA